MKKLVPYCLFSGKPQPWLRLFLRCESGGDQFYVIEVYETERQMQRAISRQNVNSEGRRHFDPNCKACCFSYTAYDGNHKRTNEIGTIFFYRKFVTPAALAHEFTHAAMSWARRRRMNLNVRNSGHYARDAEERVCHMVGYMMWQFYEKQRKRIYFVMGSDCQWRDVKKCLKKDQNVAIRHEVDVFHGKRTTEHVD